jgi:uncharacterized membrane protein YiaA
MPVFAFGHVVLLVGMWARDLMLDPNGFEIGVQALVFTAPITLTLIILRFRRRSAWAWNSRNAR